PARPRRDGGRAEHGRPRAGPCAPACGPAAHTCYYRHPRVARSIRSAAPGAAAGGGGEKGPRSRGNATDLPDRWGGLGQRGTVRQVETPCGSAARHVPGGGHVARAEPFGIMAVSVQRTLPGVISVPEREGKRWRSMTSG